MTFGPIVGVVLAAGSSSRLGRPKQLLPFRGETLLSAVVREAIASPCDAVAVVLGAHEETIRPKLDGVGAELLSNPAWREGMASSVRCAIAWAEDRRARAALLMVCDQPRLSRAYLARIVVEHARTGATVASRYRGILGVPAIFPRTAFARLGALRGLEGARCALRDGAAPVALDWPEGAFDVDLPEHAMSLAST